MKEKFKIREEKMSFTGNKDVDRTILLTLDDYDLANICKTNKYFKSLCSEELIWKTKTLEKFKYEIGGIEKLKKYMQEYGFKTWRSYYISLIDFLEKKWRGKLSMSFEEREDLKRLNNNIDGASDRFLEDLDDFLESWNLSGKSLKVFMDDLLEYDLLDPNVIFENINSYKYDNIEKYTSYIVEYMLSSKDRRIHPENSDNKLLREFAYNVDWNNETEMLFKMILKDPRVDPNCFFDFNSSIIFGKFADLILSDVRLRPASIKTAIERSVGSEIETYATDLIPLSEAFLNRGGDLTELVSMLKKTRDYNKRGFKILKDSVEQHSVKLGLIKRVPILWY